MLSIIRHLPTTPTPDGFTFGDGVNSIKVTLQPLDGTDLTRTVRSARNADGPRVAENAGYSPDRRLPEHRVKIVIQVK